ncbi:oligoendopeptidase [Bacillus licheniformis WX-02]|nr:hypothetical protein [Bacillus licheniformis]AKQ74736.1 oligoendopeptidase [Bacillus licheniformis WX-02]
MTFHQLKDTWDLEVFFKGGSGSAEFRQYLNEIKTSRLTSRPFFYLP